MLVKTAGGGEAAVFIRGGIMRTVQDREYKTELERGNDMRYINTLHEGRQSGTSIYVKENVLQRRGTGNHTII